MTRKAHFEIEKEMEKVYSNVDEQGRGNLSRGELVEGRDVVQQSLHGPRALLRHVEHLPVVLALLEAVQGEHQGVEGHPHLFISFF